jgi:hypothetical protein
MCSLPCPLTVFVYLRKNQYKKQKKQKKQKNKKTKKQKNKKTKKTKNLFYSNFFIVKKYKENQMI